MNSAGEFLRKNVFSVTLFLISVTLTQEKPTLSSLAPKSIFSEPAKAIPGPEKNYTGIRVKYDSLLVAYYHGQTVAVVETDASRTLYNCELLEVKSDADKRATLISLKSVVATQIQIALTDMLDLMEQCKKLNFPMHLREEFARGLRKVLKDSRQLTSIFSGLYPGTKWCGAGDIAATYFDLGSDREIDKCCRNHDLCPVKVAGLKTQYNLTNYAIYTRSHCLCDYYFYDCLKILDTTSSKSLGRLYFNVTPLVCIEDVTAPADPLQTKRQFAIKSKRF